MKMGPAACTLSDDDYDFLSTAPSTQAADASGGWRKDTVCATKTVEGW
jgi:hypothetical protein